MGRTACTEPQYLYSRAIPLLPLGPYGLYRASVPVQRCTLSFLPKFVSTKRNTCDDIWHWSLTPAPTARNQSTTASFQKLPDSVVKPVSNAGCRQSTCQAKTFRLSIGLRSAVGFLHVMFVRDKQMPTSNVMLYLSYCGGCVAVRYVVRHPSCVYHITYIW
jgi:hypothetical protein